MIYDFDTPIERKGSGCFKYDALKMIYGRDNLLPLWVADMDFAVAPVIQEALQQRLLHPVFGYNLRLPGYYEAVMNWTESRYNWTTQREWIVSTPGVVPALCLAILSLTEPGVGVLIQPPVYQPFHAAVTDHGRTLLCNHLVQSAEGWEIDFEDFERQAQKAKLFILCNPHNPTGRVFSKGELLRLGEICRRHRVLIFSDEIHADIVYPGSSHVSISSLEDLGEITLTGFSPAKSFNLAGLATAVLMVPNAKLREAVSGLNNKLHLYMGNSFGIAALEAAYRHGLPWLEELNGYLQGNRDLITAFLKDQLPEIQASAPEGTYLYWLNFQALGLKTEELQRLLTDTARIALDTGFKYGKGYELYHRINFGCSRSLLQEGLDRLLQAIRSI